MKKECMQKNELLVRIVLAFVLALLFFTLMPMAIEELKCAIHEDYVPEQSDSKN